MGREDDPLMAMVGVSIYGCSGVTYRQLRASSEDLSVGGVHLVPFHPPPQPCVTSGSG